MKLQFKHQKFQADAAKSVCDVFAGQPYLTPSYMMDKGYVKNNQITLDEAERFTGFIVMKWKVRNVGAEAERRDCIRGDLLKTNQPERKETANFFGPHYVECYIIKNGVCVAIDHIDVPIEHS